jgi:hypothetical protein
MAVGRGTAPLPQRDDPAQERVRRWFLGLGASMWMPLFASSREGGAHVAVYSALAPTTHRPRALSGPSWDLHIGSGRPGFSQTSDGQGGWITTYERSSREPVEPLVFVREFHGVRENYCELSEEFRLFHDLFEDRATGQLLKFDDAGNSAVAAFIERTR